MGLGMPPESGPTDKRRQPGWAEVANPTVPQCPLAPSARRPPRGEVGHIGRRYYGYTRSSQKASVSSIATGLSHAELPEHSGSLPLLPPLRCRCLVAIEFRAN